MTLSAWYLALIPAAGLFGLAAGWWLRGMAAERREFDARIAAAEQRIEARQAPRHARIQPRTDPIGDYEQRLNASAARHPAGKKRLVTTSADLAPVIVPEPDTRIPMQPQAARTSGDGTVTMPVLTDTGELRAMGDAIMTRIREDEIEWAHEFRERCEADRKELIPHD